MAALVELRKRQAKESESAGPAYGAGLKDLDWYIAGDEYVVTDELGIPLHPESCSDEFTRMLKRAGLPKIRLHDSRHTTLSLMEKAGVPSSIINQQVGGTLRLVLHDEDLRPRERRGPEARSSGARQDPTASPRSCERS